MRIPVRIADIQEISPTVKSFTLALDGQPFTFLPGQWIDCFIDIDGRTEVAGYSMTSAPNEESWFSIAVKLVGDNPVTDYLHHCAKVGDVLIVEGGSGDFHYTGDESHPARSNRGRHRHHPHRQHHPLHRQVRSASPHNPHVQRQRPLRTAIPPRIRGNRGTQLQLPHPIHSNPPAHRTLGRIHWEDRHLNPARRRSERQHTLLHLRPARNDSDNTGRTQRNRRPGRTPTIRAVVVIVGLNPIYPVRLVRPSSRPPTRSDSPAYRPPCR